MDDQTRVFMETYVRRDAMTSEREANVTDQRDASAIAHEIIDGLTSPGARLVLHHLADADLNAFWWSYEAVGLGVKADDTS